MCDQFHSWSNCIHQCIEHVDNDLLTIRVHAGCEILRYFYAVGDIIFQYDLKLRVRLCISPAFLIPNFGLAVLGCIEADQGMQVLA